VTLRWWNDLWLNEGFASYVEYLGADHAQPTWNIVRLMLVSLKTAFIKEIPQLNNIQQICLLRKPLLTTPFCLDTERPHYSV